MWIQQQFWTFSSFRLCYLCSLAAMIKEYLFPARWSKLIVMIVIVDEIWWHYFNVTKSCVTTFTFRYNWYNYNLGNTYMYRKWPTLSIYTDYHCHDFYWESCNTYNFLIIVGYLIRHSACILLSNISLIACTETRGLCSS